MFKFFTKNNIGEPPWAYDFLVNLDEKEYPKYLAKIFNYRTGEKLPLKYDFKTKGWIIDKKRCKTFNQKIQWIKLYGVTDLMRRCTDKVAVRDYVKEKIGEEYLKPVLQIIPENNTKKLDVIVNNNSILGGEAIQEERGQLAMNKNVENKQLKSVPDCHVAIAPHNDGKLNGVSTYFDKIQWNKLPNSFVIKCNHGSSWQYIIKNKKEFLNTPQLFETVKRNITGWLEQEYWCWNGFEMQYKSIEPKLLIEPLLQQNINENPENIQLYCFNRKPKYIEHLYDSKKNQITIYDKNLKITDDIFESSENKVYKEADNIIKQLYVLSKQLAHDFNFVRVDWMLYNNVPYFEELTFSPYSGFWFFKNKKKHLKFGKLLN